VKIYRFNFKIRGIGLYSVSGRLNHVSKTFHGHKRRYYVRSGVSLQSMQLHVSRNESMSAYLTVSVFDCFILDLILKSPSVSVSAF